MASKNDTISGVQIGLGAGAAGAMAIPVAGPIISGVLGASATVAGLFKESEKIGPSAGQKMASAVQGNNLARMNSMSGLSSQDVQRIGQLDQAQKAEQMAAISSMPIMSNFDKQRLGEQLMQEMRSTNKDFTDRISMLDPTADIGRANAITSASKVKTNIDNQIHSAEIAEREHQQSVNAAKVKSFNDGISRVTSGILNYVDAQTAKEIAAKKKAAIQKKREKGFNQAPQEVLDTAINTAIGTEGFDPFSDSASSWLGEI